MNQPKLSFTKKRKYVEKIEDVYSEITQEVLNSKIAKKDFEFKTVSDTISNIDVNYHLKSSQEIEGFLKQNVIPILLLTSQHGSGKTWLIDFLLKKNNCKKITLNNLCSPENCQSNIRTCLLSKGLKKNIVVLDAVDEMHSDTFLPTFIKTLQNFLMPFKNATRKKIKSDVVFTPNLIILTATSVYSKSIKLITRSFGILEGKGIATKKNPKIQHVKCEVLTAVQILHLFKNVPSLDMKLFKNLLQTSSDINYIANQIYMNERGIGTIDSKSNVDIFKLGQNILNNPKPTKLENLEKQWQKGGDMIPYMIHNSFLNCTNNLDTCIELLEVYSFHDTFSHDYTIDSCCNLLELSTMMDAYHCLIPLAHKIFPCPIKQVKRQGKKDKKKKEQGELIPNHEFKLERHNGFPFSRLETYFYIVVMNKHEQDVKLKKDVNFKLTDDYKLSLINFNQDLSIFKTEHYDAEVLKLINCLSHTFSG
jgi:hypothetical protein